MSKAGGANKKHNRNATKCAKYRSERRGERNTERRVAKHAAMVAESQERHDGTTAHHRSWRKRFEKWSGA